MKNKLVIGLTGGFGSGKSTVAKMFRKKGATVIDADQIAHQALKKNNPLFKKIKVLFPEALSRCGRHMNRKKIAEKIFSNSGKRERLEALIHPYVFKRIQKKTVTSKKRIVVAEVPLLFEAGFDRGCDRTLAVTCRRPVKITRLLAKGFSRKEIASREKAQMKKSLKIKKADFVIDNSSSVAKTQDNANRLWNRLENLKSDC